jgi:hypothetical protein
MMYAKVIEYWLTRVGDIPHTYKCYNGRSVSCSKHRTFPARMMRKVVRLKRMN